MNRLLQMVSVLGMVLAMAAGGVWAHSIADLSRVGLYARAFRVLAEGSQDSSDLADAVQRRLESAEGLRSMGWRPPVKRGWRVFSPGFPGGVAVLPGLGVLTLSLAVSAWIGAWVGLLVAPLLVWPPPTGEYRTSVEGVRSRRQARRLGVVGAVMFIPATSMAAWYITTPRAWTLSAIDHFMNEPNLSVASVVLWMVLTAAAGGWLAAVFWRARVPGQELGCPGCGYSRRGIASESCCPECGCSPSASAQRCRFSLPLPGTRRRVPLVWLLAIAAGAAPLMAWRPAAAWLLMRDPRETVPEDVLLFLSPDRAILLEWPDSSVVVAWRRLSAGPVTSSLAVEYAVAVVAPADREWTALRESGGVVPISSDEGFNFDIPLTVSNEERTLAANWMVQAQTSPAEAWLRSRSRPLSLRTVHVGDDGSAQEKLSRAMTVFRTLRGGTGK